MIHVISNTGFPSLSRNHTMQDGVWKTFDGLSYSCKIGNFVYDWVIDAASGKVFLAVQSPTPTFSYKSYAKAECKYFDVQIGTGDAKDKDLEKSKLLNPPTNYPDPLRFNANWQNANGSMISWESNDNNTGVSLSTFVSVGGTLYDLGKPILAAALNEQFILALHSENGVAIFREYYFKYDKDTKQTTKIIRFEKKLNDLFTKDNDEIARVTGIIAELNQLKSNPPHNGASITYTVAEYSNNQVNYVDKTETLSDGMEDVFYDFRMRMKIRRYENYKTQLNTSVKFSNYYRASISPDLKTLLLHLEGTVNSSIFTAEFTSASSGLLNRYPNGFATFSLNVTWTNEEAIKQAIKDKLPEIPVKEFSYTLEFLKSKRFDEPIMDWSSGNGNDGFGGYLLDRTFVNGTAPDGSVGWYQKSLSDYGYGNAARGKLKSDKVFLFAELVGNEPTWLMANVDINVLTQVRYSTPSTFPRGQLTWKEVYTR